MVPTSSSTYQTYPHTGHNDHGHYQRCKHTNITLITISTTEIICRTSQDVGLEMENDPSCPRLGVITLGYFIPSHFIMLYRSESSSPTPAQATAWNFIIKNISALLARVIVYNFPWKIDNYLPEDMRESPGRRASSFLIIFHLRLFFTKRYVSLG